MAPRVLAAITGSLTPKEELESSMEALERETLRIRMEQQKKTTKPTHQELVARNNAKGRVVLHTPKQIPTMAVIETVHVRKRIKDATIGQPAEYALVAVQKKVEVPLREFLSVGAWGW